MITLVQSCATAPAAEAGARDPVFRRRWLRFDSCAGRLEGALESEFGDADAAVHRIGEDGGLGSICPQDLGGVGERREFGSQRCFGVGEGGAVDCRVAEFAGAAEEGGS